MSKTIKGQYGEYILTSFTIGQGGISTIYKGFKVDEGSRQKEKVAIKKVSKQNSYGGDNLYYEQELEITKELIQILKNSPSQYIISILDISQGEDFYYIITQYYKYGDFLAFLLKSHEYFTYEIVLDILIQIIKAISYLHSHKIIHRDLKPENILIAKEDNFYFIKVADFGIATYNNQKLIGGTMNYISPEVLNNQNQTEKIDIWSFGCIAYEIITKQQFFIGQTQQQVAKEIIKYKESQYKNQDRNDNYYSIHRIIQEYCLQPDINKRQEAQFIENELLFLKQKYQNELKENDYDLIRSREVVFQSIDFEESDIDKIDLSSLMGSHIFERQANDSQEMCLPEDNKELSANNEQEKENSQIDLRQDQIILDNKFTIEKQQINPNEQMEKEIQQNQYPEEICNQNSNNINNNQSQDSLQNLQDNQMDHSKSNFQINLDDIQQKLEDSISKTNYLSEEQQELSDLNSFEQNRNSGVYKQEIFSSDNNNNDQRLISSNNDSRSLENNISPQNKESEEEKKTDNIQLEIKIENKINKKNRINDNIRYFILLTPYLALGANAIKKLF